MTFSRIPCWPAAYGPGKPNAPGEAILWTCVKAMSLEIQPGPGSHAVEELQEILACVEHKALVPRKTHHTLDVASFPSQERWCIGWLSSDRILEKIKRKSFVFFFCCCFYQDIEDFRLWLFGPIDFGLWQGRASCLKCATEEYFLPHGSQDTEKNGVPSSPSKVCSMTTSYYFTSPYFLMFLSLPNHQAFHMGLWEHSRSKF